MSTATSPEERRNKAFQESKTYGLMALAKGIPIRTKAKLEDKGPEDTVMTWPTVVIIELTVFMAVLAALLILSVLFDAPLKEIANPAVPENPAKAPWYFLGLQELVGYSALAGGMIVPGIALVGLALIPYLDRETGFIGHWFSGKLGKRITIETAVFSFIVTAGLIAITVQYGWLRSWFPTINQLFIIAINPGTIIVAAAFAWSVYIVLRSKSRRMGAISVFTFFLVSFLVLTYVATFLRGPNWGFYWSSADWPGGH